MSDDLPAPALADDVPAVAAAPAADPRRVVRARRLLIAAIVCVVSPLVYGAVALSIGTRASADLSFGLCLAIGFLGLGLAIAAIVTFRSLPSGVPARRVAVLAGGLAAFAVPANLFAGGLVQLARALGEGLHGRPFRVGGQALRTPVRRRSAGGTSAEGWTHGEDGGESDDLLRHHVVDGLSPELRAFLGDGWAADASLEHASIAAFSALSIDLLALAAPPSLIRRAHEAALDEIEHARLCFALASQYAGAVVSPDALPAPAAGAPEAIADRLRRVALETAVDGCVGEGAAAAVARIGAKSAKNGDVSRLLSRLATDERRHADFAWDLLVYLLDEGDEALGVEVRAALESERARGETCARERAWGDDPARRLQDEAAAQGRVGAATWAAERARAATDTLAKLRVRGHAAAA
jgi:hypothetical protein